MKRSFLDKTFKVIQQYKYNQTMDSIVWILII